MQLKCLKCSFMRPKVTYQLGHVISQEGIHPTEDKIQAVRNASLPTTTVLLKSFLGLFLVSTEFVSFAGSVSPKLVNFACYTNCFRKMPNGTRSKSRRKLMKEIKPTSLQLLSKFTIRVTDLCSLPVILCNMELVQYWLTLRRMDYPSLSHSL